MNPKIIKEIVSVLDSPTAISDKQSALYEMQKHRRGDNRKLLYIVCRLLEDHILPIHFSESVDLSCLNNSTDDILRSLKTIVVSSKCNEFNGVCGEALWLHYHELDLAKISINAYTTILEGISPDDEIQQTQFVLSVCRIYSKCKIKEYPFNSFFDKTISFVSANFDLPGFCILFILTGLAACGERYDELKQTYEGAISHYENQNKFERAISFIEGLESLYEKFKVGDKKEALVRMAKNYENEANLIDWSVPGNSHRVISLIHKSMNAWERVNDAKAHDERKRLAKRIEPVKQLSLQSLQTFTSKPIDISEWIETVEDFINDATLEAIIYRLAEFVPLKSPADLKEMHKSSRSVFADFFQTTITDSDGRIRCIIPAAGTAKDEDLIHVLEHEASKYYLTVADGFIQRYLWLCKKKFDFTEENIGFLVENNVFIPENRKDSIIKGLVAGFNLDLATSMYLLMPQIEHSIRCLARECGAVVYKTHKTGVEECLSLESILKTPEIIECLDETFLFNLKLFYTSEYGFGMRNIVGHGLNSDKELQSSASLATWWFTLKICCMYSNELAMRLNKQIEEKLKIKDEAQS